MARTTDKNERALYKAALTQAVEWINGFAGSGDAAIAFWSPAAAKELQRQLAHPSLSVIPAPEVKAARKQLAEHGPEDRALRQLERERDAAVAALKSYRAGNREGRRGDIEGWQRLEEAERTIADLMRDRDYWQSRCESIEGVTPDPDPAHTIDPRVAAAFADDDPPFWHDAPLTVQ